MHNRVKAACSAARRVFCNGRGFSGSQRPAGALRRAQLCALPWALQLWGLARFCPADCDGACEPGALCGEIGRDFSFLHKNAL